MEVSLDTISGERIETAEDVIRPYIRRTPVVEIDGRDFGLDTPQITLKLEFVQHSGSFKSRGAFANLLLRDVPQVGVVAASGGNHGVAVAYAAMRLKVPAKIFLPSISSPAKIASIRDHGADLVIGGDRYADALAASEQWARWLFTPSMRSRRCWVPARLAANWKGKRPIWIRSWSRSAAPG